MLHALTGATLGAILCGGLLAALDVLAPQILAIVPGYAHLAPHRWALLIPALAGGAWLGVRK